MVLLDTKFLQKPYESPMPLLYLCFLRCLNKFTESIGDGDSGDIAGPRLNVLHVSHESEDGRDSPSCGVELFARVYEPRGLWAVVAVHCYQDGSVMLVNSRMAMFFVK